jgi:hypothetical protein
MFYGRPDIPQLGLDLTELEGGGSFPSQFEGRIANGRPIFIHYRGGWLTVYAGPPGAKPREAKEVLLEACIGWPLHGVLLKEQACDLAGLTIRGRRPVLSDEALRAAADKDDVRDWSGRTTYWIRPVLATEEGGRRLARELASIDPAMRMLEIDWLRGPLRRFFVPRMAISDCRHSVIFAFGANEKRLAGLLAGIDVPLAELDEAFACRVSFHFGWRNSSRGPSFTDKLASKHGRNMVFASMRTLSGGFRTQFSTDDAKEESLVRNAIEAIQSCFANWVEDIDLSTGEPIGGPKAGFWYSPDLRDWCSAAPDRYLSCRIEEDGLKRDIGIRACSPPR